MAQTKVDRLAALGMAPELAKEVTDQISDASGGSVAWADVTGKPTTFPPVIGTTATTAKAGNYAPAWGDVTGKPATFAPTIGTTATTAKAGNAVQTATQTTATAIAPGTATNVQAILAELAARITALENA